MSERFKTGDDLVLVALEREHTRLSSIATKAKAEADEYLGIGSTLATIWKELDEIIGSNSYGPQVLKRLDDLKRREAKANRIRKKDLVTLLDRQYEAEWERDLMAQELSAFQFRMALRNRR